MAEKIGIDEIDCKIMDLIQKEPSLTHTQIAEHVNRSQPTVGMRIKKLENLGVLKYQAGINIKVADLY
ncbi:MAG: Lrp/AsnC family transcriptional regulator, partial [Promethearchaeota archaeon]